MASPEEPRHDAPWYSSERLAYFEAKMDEFASKGHRHLVFTPPCTRSSLLTHCEAWAVNLQRDYVPTLASEGRWPIVRAGAHPSETLSREQVEWIKRRWGECANLWVARGCPRSAKISSMSEHRAAKKQKDYRDLVLRTLQDIEHQDRRAFLERRADVERAGRERL